MTKYRILIADDDKLFVDSAKAALTNFNINSSYSIHDTKSNINSNIDLILLDLVFDESHPTQLDGLELIPFIKNNFPDMQVIVMTNYDTIDIAIASIKKGADDFLSKKTLNWIEWRNRIENYCKLATAKKELKSKSNFLSPTDIIGSSKLISDLRLRLKDLAENSSDITIFISGETGTGKNLAVQFFRKHSPRRDKPYKEFSISELSETVLESELFGHVKGAFTGADKDKKGLFEEADGGILFLDEIGDIDQKIQKKIMRFIEDKTITPVGSTKNKKLDVQLILATNQDLQKLVSDGKFREDLYYRINVAKIVLPPLRERREDIIVLTDYFFNHFKEREKTNLKSISEETYDAMQNCDWRGNVRELYFAIQTACTKARLSNDVYLKTQHLPEEILHSKTQAKTNSENENDVELKKALIELEAIEKALEKAHGKKSDAAKILGMSLDQMRYRVEKLRSILNGQRSLFPFITNKYVGV